MNTSLNTFSPATMSSREVAELTGKAHPKVTADIEKMLIELGEDAAAFRYIYRDSMNREQVEFHLDRELTLARKTALPTNALACA